MKLDLWLQHFPNYRSLLNLYYLNTQRPPSSRDTRNHMEKLPSTQVSFQHRNQYLALFPLRQEISQGYRCYWTLIAHFHTNPSTIHYGFFPIASDENPSLLFNAQEIHQNNSNSIPPKLQGDNTTYKHTRLQEIANFMPTTQFPP